MTHTHTHSVGILWTRSQPVGKTSSWQQTSLTRKWHPCFLRNSNLQFQQASGLRPITRPKGSTIIYLFIYLFIHSFIHVYTVSTGLETGFRPQHYHKWTLGLLPAKYNVIIQYGVLTQFRAFSYKFLTQGAPYLGYHKYLNRGIKSANT